jgi:hypothetical protein
LQLVCQFGLRQIKDLEFQRLCPRTILMHNGIFVYSIGAKRTACGMFFTRSARLSPRERENSAPSIASHDRSG